MQPANAGCGNRSSGYGVLSIMRRFSFVLLGLFLSGVSLNVLLQAQSKQTVTFVWTYGRFTFGTLEVPSGFTETTENYREGIVTRCAVRTEHASYFSGA